MGGKYGSGEVIGAGDLICGEMEGADEVIRDFAAAVTAENDAGVDEGAGECEAVKEKKARIISVDCTTTGVHMNVQECRIRHNEEYRE